jgi:crotonobetainyl-CoA:carnitine CoA-transferase CaiB-like acyl-CoA transferase
MFMGGTLHRWTPPHASAKAGPVTDPAPYLSGIRVLDFTQYLAGPSCTRLLAELGADVIKVEQPPHGDPMRAQAPRRNRRSGSFIQQNRGKRSLCVDLSQPDGVALVYRLVPQVDLVVENFTPGVMARRGLGYEDLSRVNPGLIMASVSGFGQTGAMASRSSFDFIAQAYSGIMHMTGEADGPPLFVGAGMGDTNAGVHAFAGIGFALFNRERTGRGVHIDISMIDALFHFQEQAVQAASLTNGEFSPRRQGRHYQPLAPAGSYQGPQGWIVLLCSVNQIDNLWAALGRPELAKDERFADNDARVANRDELTAIIETWMAGFDSDAAVLAALEAHRVPCGPVLNPADAANHPYFTERGAVREIHDPVAGSFLVPGFPIRYSDSPGDLELVAPNLGEHNAEVLTEMLGFSPEETAELEVQGVLGYKDR